MNTKKMSIQWLFGKLPSNLLANGKANIQIDTDWLNGQHDENFEDMRNTVDHTISFGATFTSEDNNFDTDQDNDSYDELDKDDIQTGIVDMDTMLNEQDIPQRHVTLEDVAETVPEELTFSPGEGQKCVGVLKGTDSEYLTFPSVFVENGELIIRIDIYLSTTVISINMNYHQLIGKQQQIYKNIFQVEEIRNEANTQ